MRECQLHQLVCISFIVFLFAVFSVTSVTRAADQLVLFREVTSGNSSENIAVSPYGVNLAFALVVPGAKGETETELRTLLGFDGGIDVLAKSLKIAEYAEKGSPLKTATSLWIQKDYNVLPEFTETAKKHFAVDVEIVDFQTDPSGTCKTINDWVDNKTNSKIKKLFEKVETSNRVIAVSAIYFLADWLTQFDKKLTQKEDFTLLNGEKHQVDMMRLPRKSFRYGKIDNAQCLEMPYKNRGYSAIVILPNEGVDPAAVIDGLTPKKFNDVIGSLKSRKVNLKLPRFEVEYGTSLKGALVKSGVKTIFTKGAADLSGISDKRDLVVSDVIQKVFIKVDEVGTEAAAATGVSISTTSMDVIPPLDFHVDRPFIFVVKEGDNILFISKIIKP